MDPSASQDVSLDALIFFATHSLLIIAIAGVVFFSLGLWVGWLTWAKFKRRARAYSEELQIQRREIANLKRRITQDSTMAEDAAPPLELTPLLSEPLFEAAKNPIAAATEQALSEAAAEAAAEPKQEDPTPPSPEQIKHATLAEAVLRTGPPPGQASEPPASETAPAPKELKEKKTLKEASKQKAPPSTAKDSPAPEPLPPTTKPVEKKAAPPPLPAAAAGSPAEFPAPDTITLPLQLPEIPVLKSPIGRSVTRSLARPVENGNAVAAQAEPDEQELAVEEGRGKRDDKLGFIYLTRPERSDDLTLLRGVGEGLSAKLQDLGIHTFRQIASWTAEQVTEFDHRLLTKDRIRREHWVKQARNLHFLKYGVEISADL
jgi:predicted flap endonuclease-1-like 5' DNA nuclease